jgi:hypothetical protein
MKALKAKLLDMWVNWLRPGQLTVTVTYSTRNGNISKSDYAKDVMMMVFAQDVKELCIDWADGSTTNIPMGDLRNLLVSK